MYLGTTLTGVLLVAASVLALVIANRKRTRKTQLLLNSLKDLAAKYNSKISEHEVWNGTAIGIDKDFMKLFFMRSNANNLTEIEVNLSEIQKCRMVTTGRSIKSKDGDTRVIERLELGLILNEKNRPDVLLEFYDNNRDNITLDGELQLVEKWVKLLNDLLEDKKKSKRHF